MSTISHRCWALIEEKQKLFEAGDIRELPSVVEQIMYGSGPPKMPEGSKLMHGASTCKFVPKNDFLPDRVVMSDMFTTPNNHAILYSSIEFEPSDFCSHKNPHEFVKFIADARCKMMELVT